MEKKMENEMETGSMGGHWVSATWRGYCMTHHLNPNFCVLSDSDLNNYRAH